MKAKRQFGLLGYPLGHSFSQKFFSQKFEAENIDAVFTNYEIAEVDKILLAIESTPMLEGFNVTIPYKQAIMPLLDELSDEAQEIGAVNVVKVCRNGTSVKLKGYNSDAVGFVNSIAPLLDKQLHQKALVLGTGGASKAVVYGLKQLGVGVKIVSRTKSDSHWSYDELTKEILSDYKVIVNCTPLGTFPNVQEAPAIPYKYLVAEHLLYDLVYNPEETEFLKRGKEKGAKIKNGAEMLRLQALKAWEIWNEKQ